MAIPGLSRLDKRGGSRVVTNARRDAVDATVSARKGKRRADLLIRERFAARRTNGAALAFYETSADLHKARRSLWRRRVAYGKTVWS
jgi:hypothetical protein